MQHPKGVDEGVLHLRIANGKEVGGKEYADESGENPLLFAHGIVRLAKNASVVSKKFCALSKRSTVAQDFLQTLEHVEDAGARQAVEDVLPASFVGHNPGVFQDGKVSGERGHVDVEHFEYHADALFPFGEFLDDLQSGRMSESLENLRLPLDGQLARCRGAFHGGFLSK